VQSDEVWGYVRCKKKTKERRKIADPDAGDAYCLIGIERHSKLVLAWHLGRRDRWDTHDFMAKLAAATTAERFQLTTDGFNACPDGTGPPAPHDPAVERVQPQAVEPPGRSGALLRLLQLLPVPQEHPHDSGDGGRLDPAPVEHWRSAPGGGINR
jgi:hypothetical protein